MCFNESDLLAVRQNSLIFIYNQSRTESQTSKWVKPVSAVSEFVNMPSCQGNESYGNKQERNRSSCNIIPFSIKEKYLICPKQWNKRNLILIIIRWNWQLINLIGNMYIEVLTWMQDEKLLRKFPEQHYFNKGGLPENDM